MASGVMMSAVASASGCACLREASRTGEIAYSTVAYSPRLTRARVRTGEPRYPQVSGISVRNFFSATETPVAVGRAGCALEFAVLDPGRPLVRAGQAALPVVAAAGDLSAAARPGRDVPHGIRFPRVVPRTVPPEMGTSTARQADNEVRSAGVARMVQYVLIRAMSKERGVPEADVYGIGATLTSLATAETTGSRQTRRLVG